MPLVLNNMKNVFLFFVSIGIFQTHLHAFHKESYYGDPYSMEYVGKYSTVNLTKEDLLFADYIVEMLRNTSYSTIDFNASMTYPSRFQHMYETGVPTFTTRRFATTSTKSPTTEKKWAFPQNQHFFDVNDIWETSSSISSQFSTIGITSSRRQKKKESSLLLNKIESRHLKTKNITPLFTKMREDRLAMVRDIIRRSIIEKKTNKYTERHILHQVTKERKKQSICHISDCTTTRARRSIPFHLNSDSGPWLTSKEQEQVWALRGTSLLDSEKYDFPFPYDFDKWPGCTTKDLTDPKNTVQVLEYENGHVRFLGVSKPGWNEFPWKPTEFTTEYPAYRRLDRYLTYLSKPWYGYYSTLTPTLPRKWGKKTTRPWSRYTFANRSWKSKYEMGKLIGSKKWIIDRWPPFWNRTIYPSSQGKTQKRTWWGGKWHLPTRRPSLLYANLNSSKLNTNTMTPYAQTSKPSANTKKPALHPQKPISTTSKLNFVASKSTSGFGFLSLSPTWFAYHKDMSITFRYSNATWVSQWSRMLYEASSKLALKKQTVRVWNLTSNLSNLEQWNKQFPLPIYTYAKTTSSKQWGDDLLNQLKKGSTSTWSGTHSIKPSQSQSKDWNAGYPDKLNTEKPCQWNTYAKQNKGGWSLPALTKISKKLDTWSKTWYPNKPFQQFYTNQGGRGGWSNTWNKQVTPTYGRAFYQKSSQKYLNQWNKGRPPLNTKYQTGWNGNQFQNWNPSPQQYRGVPKTWTKTWTDQWNRQQSLTWSRTWYTKPNQQFHSKQWKEGGWSRSNAWNRQVPMSENKPYIPYINTKSPQQYSNQWGKVGPPTRSGMWNTKPYYPSSNQRNIGVEKPREWSPWSTQPRGGWSQTWNRGQYPTRSRTWYANTKP